MMVKPARTISVVSKTSLFLRVSTISKKGGCPLICRMGAGFPGKENPGQNAADMSPAIHVETGDEAERKVDQRDHDQIGDHLFGALWAKEPAVAIDENAFGCQNGEKCG